MSSDAHDIKKEVKIYYWVFAALMVLTVVTVGASYLPAGLALGIAIALFIAIIKGSFVASYFMHLRSEKKMIYVVLLMTTAFLAGMMILFITSYYDIINGSEYLGQDQPKTEHQVESHTEHHVP